MREMKDSGIEWIGEIPKSWICCKQKYEIKLINGRAYSDSEFEEDGKYPILRVGNLFSNPVWYSSSMELEPDKFCEKGDLLYSWSMSYAPVIWEGEKVIYHYHIWKAKLTKSLDKKFAYYYLLSLTDALKAEIHETTMGFITMGVMNNSYIAFPSIEEQHRISYYLDSKCFEIDALTADIQTQIDTLEQYKRSVITEAVTKGLDKQAHVKDSGVFYMAPMNENWYLTKIGYICSKLARSFEPEDTALICSNKGKVLIRPEDASGIMVSEDNAMQGIHEGDIAIHGMDTWHGAIALSDYDGKITRVVHVCDSTEDKRFIVYYLQYLAFQGVYKLISNGVRENTSDFRSWDKVRDIWIAIPKSKSEQKEICDYLDDMCAEIEGTVAIKNDQLATLYAYKKSIIYEYVTGKKEVPAV